MFSALQVQLVKHWQNSQGWNNKVCGLPFHRAKAQTNEFDNRVGALASNRKASWHIVYYWQQYPLIQAV